MPRRYNAISTGCKDANQHQEKERSFSLAWVDAASLSENPNNWRTHPQQRLDGIRAAIREVGWAGAFLYNKRTKRLIDGHARKKIFEGHGEVSVLIGSWTEEQERRSSHGGVLYS